MKTFIFLLILIASFFSYIFTVGSNRVPSQGQPELVMQQTPTLEIIEKESAYNEISEEVQIYENANDTLTANNFDSLETPSIPESMTFDTFSTILCQINPYYPKHAITLNLPLSSVIRTEEEKEAFRKKMQNDFHLPAKEIDQMMQQNKLIWDWINRLR